MIALVASVFWQPCLPLYSTLRYTRIITHTKTQVWFNTGPGPRGTRKNKVKSITLSNNFDDDSSLFNFLPWISLNFQTSHKIHGKQYEFIPLDQVINKCLLLPSKECISCPHQQQTPALHSECFFLTWNYWVWTALDKQCVTLLQAKTTKERK